MVHLGKHGNLEWLPGKNIGMSAACGTDAALGNLPLTYPFLVNDPGEGTQAKRRAHATIVDHLVSPAARAESYSDIARLEKLLDENAGVAAMDPSKLPAIRSQIWTLIQAAKMDHDLGLSDRPEADEFDDLLLHVNGWLCEVKDAQIRGRAERSQPGACRRSEGEPGAGDAAGHPDVGGSFGAVPGLRAAMGQKDDADLVRLSTVDAVEQQARSLVQLAEDSDWKPATIGSIVAQVLGHQDEAVERVLHFAATEGVPRLARITDELTAVLHALDGASSPRDRPGRRCAA